MNTKNSVEAGNDHLETLINYTRRMVKANRIAAEKAPEFLVALSEAMTSTVARFQDVVETVTAVSGTEVAAHGVHEVAATKHPRTAKLRQKLLENKEVAPESVPLPAVVIAQRYVAPKRTVGRPRKDAPPVVLTPEQLAFDRDFLAKYPPINGLDATNSIGRGKITVLFDGKKLKMIKRHLKTKYGISFDDYKRIYSLPDNYPSVAPGYSSERRKHAIRQGLGTDKVSKAPKTEVTAEKVVPFSASVDASAAA
jgi:hypothetical protein|nr:MucR family transcriptional regulator [Neorhizobium tomejilense]